MISSYYYCLLEKSALFPSWKLETGFSTLSISTSITINSPSAFRASLSPKLINFNCFSANWCKGWNFYPCLKCKHLFFFFYINNWYFKWHTPHWSLLDFVVHTLFFYPRMLQMISSFCFGQIDCYLSLTLDWNNSDFQSTLQSPQH